MGIPGIDDGRCDLAVKRENNKWACFSPWVGDKVETAVVKATGKAFTGLAVGNTCVKK